MYSVSIIKHSNSWEIHINYPVELLQFSYERDLCDLQLIIQMFVNVHIFWKKYYIFSTTEISTKQQMDKKMLDIRINDGTIIAYLKPKYV